jgi:hypothetical protein
LFTRASFILIIGLSYLPTLSAIFVQYPFGLPSPLQQNILGRSDVLTWNRTPKYPRLLHLVVTYSSTHLPDWVLDTSFPHKTEVMYYIGFLFCINSLNTELNSICHLLALLGTHPILHVSRIRVKEAGPPTAGSGLGIKKNFFGPTNRGGPAKNLYTKSERLTLSCRVTRVWSERVNLHSRQMIKKKKKLWNIAGPR